MFNVDVYTREGEKLRFTDIAHVNFINPETHGDPAFLVERANYEDDEDILYVCTGTALAVRVRRQ